jgi:hypothetical protein
MADNYEVRLDNPTALSTDAVTLQSPTLVKGLVKNPTATLNLLSTKFAPVSLSDIDVDDQGLVVVKNQAFRDALLQAVGNGHNTSGNNCAC